MSEFSIWKLQGNTLENMLVNTCDKLAKVVFHFCINADHFLILW